MPRFRISTKALDDLKSIGQYTESNWGRAQRNRYLTMLDTSFHTIADEPGIGTACDNIKPGYRKYHAERHLIFYKIVSDVLEIIRILHVSMDINRHF